ncbi:MAG: hypothetical protein NTY95_07935 [Bacteroidia bacterium]|nr:hypothetical protein [Bacteroidia bacterium]
MRRLNFLLAAALGGSFIFTFTLIGTMTTKEKVVIKKQSELVLQSTPGITDNNKVFTVVTFQFTFRHKSICISHFESLLFPRTSNPMPFFHQKNKLKS